MPQIWGTPTTGGTFKPSIIATDANGNTSDPVELDITINAGALALSVTTTALAAGTAGQAYSFQLGAQGGTGTGYTWTLISGSLSGSGISLASSGLLSGSTPVTGTYSGLVFQVTDSASNTALSPSMALTVNSGTVTLAVTTTALAAGTLGIPYSFQLGAQGGTGTGYTWTLLSGSLSGSGISLASSGLLSGTAPAAGTYTGLVFKVTDSGAHTAQSQPLTLSVVTPAPAMFPLPILVELLLGSAWTDISEYVYQRDGVHITGGKTDRSGQANPAQCTLTLNNRDGRFSPGFTNGAYYPHLTRSNQLRVSLVAATSSSGNVYTGYRFWGEVTEWPPLSDISGNDVYVSVTANGPLRRIRQGGGEGSALQRYYASLTAQFAPVAYWPCEEDPDSGSIGAGVEGGANMAVTGGPPVFKSVSDFNGSAPIGVLNRSTWDGLTGNPAGSFTGNDVYSAPGTYTWTAATTTVTANVWGAGGGGNNGSFGAGGSGGGFDTASVAVTPGNTYAVVVGAGGDGGAAGSAPANNNPGRNGGKSTFTGDTVTITGLGGIGGPDGNGPAAGVSGTGTGGTPHTSGAGGAGLHNANFGAGGGSSAGLTGNGHAGAAANNSGQAAGGAAPSGGGKGGAGGLEFAGGQGSPGANPGGGGGGGGQQPGFNHAGGGGGTGQVQLLYAAPAGPPANIIRFIMFVPAHGGNNAAVLLRAFTGGTIARLDCQYRNGGNIRLFGYNNASTQILDSGNLNVSADGRTLMVSLELTASGTSVNWNLAAIKPGNPWVGNQQVSGTLASAAIGYVSEIIAGPNSDVTKTALGHISCQDAYIPLWKVSQALDGHQFEGGPDRFTRLANEQAMGNIVQWAETVDHWGFEDGTVQSWAATHGTVTNTTTSFNSQYGFPLWPTEGTHSLLLTADGTGSPSANSLTGLSGQPVQPGDVASVSVDLYSATQRNNAYIGLQWFDATGAFLSETDTADTTLPAGQPVTFRLSGKDAIAPAGAQFLAVTFGNHALLGSGAKIYADHIRLSPHMGPQTRKAYQAFLEEIQDLDQGILKEAKELWGMKFGTRIHLINQPSSVQLDYGQAMLSPPLAPVVDIQNVKNNIIVHRHKGSKVEVTLDDGQMSINEPPAGVGRFKKTLQAVAAADEQLAALAQHLLTLGTDASERYPTITVDLTRASIAGNALAPLMSAVAGVEVGDVVELVNLPFFYPSTDSKQMVIGYDETINSRQWLLTFNCLSYSPWIQVTTSLRRW